MKYTGLIKTMSLETKRHIEKIANDTIAMMLLPRSPSQEFFNKLFETIGYEMYNQGLI